MGKQEHTLTLRIPKETMRRLRKVARDNHCSVSDVARDILSVHISEDNYEHAFLNRESWTKAVKARDNNRCVRCGSEKDVEVYVRDSHSLAEDVTLSDGITLCYTCYRNQKPPETALENGHSVYDVVPPGWIRKYKRAREKGKVFWERHLACFLTRRKRTLSPIVEWYAETFLREVPEEVIIRTLIALCPSPEIIANFPSRQQSSPTEIFPPPPLMWG